MQEIFVKQKQDFERKYLLEKSPEIGDKASSELKDFLLILKTSLVKAYELIEKEQGDKVKLIEMIKVLRFQKTPYTYSSWRTWTNQLSFQKQMS